MKLLYATSALYPSRLANRAQIYAMAEAFHGMLGDRFALGMPASSVLEAAFPIVRVPGSLRSIALAWRYAWIIEREGFTDVFCREERLFTFMRLFARMRGLRTRFHFEAHWMRTDLFFRYALRRADTVVAITAALADDLAASGAQRSRLLVAPDGVDLSRYERLPGRAATRARFRIPETAFVAGYTGSFSAHHDWKGVDVVIEAARRAPQVTFWLVGGEPDEIARLRPSMPANVRLEGFQSKADIPAIQTACDALVLPNKKGNAIAERYTSPLKLFEYLASGVPVVASDLPSAREIVGDDTAYLIRANDPDALLSALNRIKADPAAAYGKAERARVLVQAFTWDKRARSINDFISR